MQRVIINMKSFVLGEAVQMALRNNGDFQVTVVERPEETAKKAYSLAATIVLMEVTGYPPYVLEERLKIRNAIKKQAPNCKIAIMVDDNSEKEVAEQVKQAKKDGLIDLFIYGSTSASYLVALLDTL